MDFAGLWWSDGFGVGSDCSDWRRQFYAEQESHASVGWSSSNGKPGFTSSIRSSTTGEICSAPMREKHLTFIICSRYRVYLLKLQILLSPAIALPHFQRCLQLTVLIVTKLKLFDELLPTRHLRQRLSRIPWCVARDKSSRSSFACGCRSRINSFNRWLWIPA